MADDTPAPPAAGATRPRKPARTTGAVAGARSPRIDPPAAEPVRAAKQRVQKRSGLVAPKPRTPLVRRRARLDPAQAFSVVDDLPRPVPVTRAELDVLERYLGPAIDALLRAMAP